MNISSLTPAQYQAILELPALTPPPGLTSNFVNPPNITDTNILLLSIGIIVPTIVVGLRVYSKFWIVRDHGIDDYTLMLGWAFYIVYCGLCGKLISEGVGRHQWDLRIREVMSIFRGLRIAFIVYGFALIFPRVSILLQFLKIFNPHNTRGFMFWSCWGGIALLTTYYAIGTLVQIFICTPIEKFWSPWMTGRCLNFRALNVVSAAVNALSDLIMLVLPQKAIWQLHMPLDKRIKVSSIFLIGLCALASSVVRLWFSVKSLYVSDIAWWTSIIGLLAFAEFITIFVCSCLPSLAQLSGHWLSKMRSGRKKVSLSRRLNDGTPGFHPVSTVKHQEVEIEQLTVVPEKDQKAFETDSELGSLDILSSKPSGVDYGYCHYHDKRVIEIV